MSRNPHYVLNDFRRSGIPLRKDSEGSGGGGQPLNEEKLEGIVTWLGTWTGDGRKYYDSETEEGELEVGSPTP